MSERHIIDLVKRYLQPLQTSIEIEVMEKGVHQEGNWWYVPIRPVLQQPKTYAYYGELVDVETELKEHENLNVLLVPTE